MAIIDALTSDPQNKKIIESVVHHIPKFRTISSGEWQQADAINTALTVFGIDQNEPPASVDVSEDSDSTLSKLDPAEFNILEDNVIARDASYLPGFQLVEKHMTGHAVFLKVNERLDVYTANRTPLEKVFGVDLIYINEVRGNIVMVQYKMLERDEKKDDWIYRPDDQFDKEMDRMELPDITGEIADYRLSRAPFYFKFVRRKGGNEHENSFIISAAHMALLRDTQKGPRGGIRLSYNSLEGTYLRENDLTGLIRSGYIGTHRIESDALSIIIDQIAKGNENIVLAWQQKRSDQSST